MNLSPSRHSIRLANYDYSNQGAYFVTICTHKRSCLFGDIISGQMHLNNIGSLVLNDWNEIPGHLPYVQLLEFIIMPNHIHGIIVINEDGNTAAVKNGIKETDTASRVPTGEPSKEAFAKPTKGSLPTIIRSYKSGVTRRIDESYPGIYSMIWQGRFYEHVIRNEQELNSIAEYIRTNPQNWVKDKNNIP